MGTTTVITYMPVIEETVSIQETRLFNIGSIISLSMKSIAAAKKKGDTKKVAKLVKKVKAAKRNKKDAKKQIAVAKAQKKVLIKAKAAAKKQVKKIAKKKGGVAAKK